MYLAAYIRLRTFRIGILLLGAASFATMTVTAAHAGDPRAPVLVAHLTGVIDQLTARYLHRVVVAAGEAHAVALVVTVDTPGGLDTSMHQMVQDLLNSPIPTIVFVWPSGARAASAGLFIAQAANLVAMAPGTNLGAAHPVAEGGDTIQGDLRDKVTNDAAAYIASIAKARGRNDTWAQAAARTSVSIDAQQAVEQHVADVMVADLPALLRSVDGRPARTTAGLVTIHTRDAPIMVLDMHPAERVLQTLIDPTIAYLLLAIGFYAILIELFHPGALVPAVTGALCLILAFVAFATLPMNWGGVLLILIAVALFVLDVQAAAHGLLTLAGLVCFILGSLLLYTPAGPRSPALPVAAVALPVVLAAAAAGALLSLLVVGTALRMAHRGPISGVERLYGAIGITRGMLNPDGTVRVGGQLWSARLRSGTLGPEQPVRVLARTGLTLEVESIDRPAASEA
jgi:membrane-bound serine protease (ClpP class)